MASSLEAARPLRSGLPRLADRLVRRAVGLCLWTACAAMVLLVVIGTVDVVGTFLFAWPLVSARELSEVLLSVAIFAGMALATREGRDVRIDLFTAGRSPRAQAVLRVLALLVAAAVFAVLAWRAWHLALDAYAIREAAVATLRFPLWPFKLLAALLLSVTVAECLRQLATRPAAAPSDAAAASHN